jgi:hypothetical protein
MKPIDDDTLQAYVDGELDAAIAARIDAALLQDEQLASRVRQLRALQLRLRAEFDPVLAEPVPTRLSDLLQHPAPSASARTASTMSHAPGRSRGAGRHRTRRWLLPSAAVAASIAMLAAGLWWKAGSDLVRVRDGQQFASGALSQALDHALAGAPDPGSSIAIGLTFRGADGRICRSFVARERPMAGLACHDAAGWSLPVLAQPTAPAGGELRQAASATAPEVQAAIDARIRGEAFDAQQERAARAAGWR